MRYVQKVKQIVKGKSDKKELLSLERRRDLASASKEDVMAEFVKVDKSEHFAQLDSDFQNGFNLMRNIMSENGVECIDLNPYTLPKREFKRSEISYRSRSELAEEEEERNIVGGADDLIMNGTGEMAGLGVPVQPNWWELDDDEEDDDEEEGDDDEDESEGEDEVHNEQERIHWFDLPPDEDIDFEDELDDEAQED